MDTKLLLVKCITILYLQGELQNNNNESANIIVGKVLELVKPADKSISTDFGHDTITQLRECLVWMSTQIPGTQYDVPSLKQRFLMATQEENYIYEALISMFLTEPLLDEEITKRMRFNMAEINTALDKLEVTEVLKSYYKQTQFGSEALDWTTLIQSINTDLQPYVNIGSSGNRATAHPSIVKSIDFGDPDSISAALEAAKDELSTKGVIRTPYQGLNRMLGPHAGMRRGEFIVIPALQHKYKSGMVMDLFLSCALFNKPHMRDPSKKPLNLRISFENTSQVDMENMYSRMMTLQTNEVIDIAKVDIAEASQYVNDKLTINGYHNKLYHIDPSDYTYMDLFNLIEELEAEGYEIHLLTLDYLNMMSKKGCNQGPHGEEIRDLFRRVRNFTSKRGICTVTPHQISTEAKMLLRNGQSNFVQQIANKGYYDGCKRIDQEVDCEVYLHIVETNGAYYLTMQRGKHRGVRTPAVNQYVVYLFDDISGLPFDLLTEDKSRKSVGADTIASGGQEAWYAGI